MKGLELGIERTSALDAWALAGGEYEDSVPPNSRLAVTHDGGQSWRTLPNPPCASHSDNRLVALPGGLLWLMCASGPGAGSQQKTLYASTDGGEGWSLLADALDGPGQIPLSGYLDKFAMTTPEQGWLGLNRGTLYGTTDAGRTWKEAVPMPGDGSIGPFYFVDPLHGWFLTPGEFYRTTDGGKTWEQLGHP